MENLINRLELRKQDLMHAHRIKEQLIAQLEEVRVQVMKRELDFMAKKPKPPPIRLRLLQEDHARIIAAAEAQIANQQRVYDRARHLLNYAKTKLADYRGEEAQDRKPAIFGRLRRN